ncbi:unnamed protein product [Polarella glacialis]|uniref:Patatin n=1 Tax=Polarella glacialis TaxID=89957 RepID=A0A813J522_POLGL|nr:unnamed protein product [Polarella glacialis]CAE8665808.1 unnamed protein product [Polarella glacialis]
MVQYISERFDTRGVKLAGVSSGAIGAVLLLALEEAAARPGPGAASSKVRRRAQEVFKLVERASSPVVKHPLGFLLRLGSVLDKVAAEVIPEKCPEGNRVRVGVRRVAGGLVPALVPGVVTGFKNREDLKEAVLASSTVWLIVRPWPCRYLACKKWFCADGVNPFSFYCLVEYLLHLRKGLAKRTAPRHTHSGGLDLIYAMWNCGVMKRLLSSRGRHIWVTPTVGGRLDLRYALRVSGWFLAEQWCQGYAHTRDLDAQGYWKYLNRRPKAA